MNEEGGLETGVDFKALEIDRDRKAVVKRYEIDRKVHFLSIFNFLF
jgi:hypothetical protein